MRRLMPQTLDVDGPVYIRVGKGGDPIVSRPDLPCEIGRAIPMRAGRDALIVTTGICLQVALEAAAMLEKQGIDAGVLHAHTVKPLDAEAILDKAATVSAMLTIEEHTLMGGLGSAVAEIIAEAGFNPGKRFKRIGLPDVFPDQYGSQAGLMARYGITASDAAAAVAGLLKAG